MGYKEKTGKGDKRMNKWRKKGKKFFAALNTGVLLVCANSVPLLAQQNTGGGGGTSTSTGIAQIDNMLATIKMLFLGIVAAIGLIILIKGIADTAQAYQQQDSHGMYDGAKGIAAGAIMVFIGAILTALGV